MKDGEQVSIAAEYLRPPGIALRNARDMESLPLVYQMEIIGQLILAPRSTGESFSAADQRLLETIARQAGVAAYNVRLTQDLQHSVSGW